MAKVEINNCDGTVVSHVMAVLRHRDGWFLVQVANSMCSGVMAPSDRKVAAALRNVARTRRKEWESGSWRKDEFDDDDCSLIPSGV